MEDTVRLYTTHFANRAYIRSVCEGLAFLAASTIAIFAAVSYATVHASNPVTDFVLSRVGPFNVRFLFVYGTFAAFVFTASLLIARPNRLPFALKAMALFLLVRAVFVALTHVAPSPIDPQQPAPFLNSIFYGSDLFFSGHTGLPFLAALAFWHIVPWRIVYLALTAFFGAVVLLGHYHYSIDVLAALFVLRRARPCRGRSGEFAKNCFPEAAVDARLNRSCCTPSVTTPHPAVRRRRGLETTLVGIFGAFLERREHTATTGGSAGGGCRRLRPSDGH
jgi:hypothetical protein